jgi:hypothetical protein
VDNSDRDNASCVATNAAGTSPSPAPPPCALATHPLYISGSASLLDAFTALIDAESYGSGEEFNNQGKCEGAFYSPSGKSIMALVCI